ncbi:MAG: hypothetical protein JJT89_01155 [Nitriliruptoraceae bacterium]|nr:hypothetical protein [Nitriliruptoraceae bacterium]
MSSIFGVIRTHAGEAQAARDLARMSSATPHSDPTSVATAISTAGSLTAALASATWVGGRADLFEARDVTVVADARLFDRSSLAARLRQPVTDLAGRSSASIIHELYCRDGTKGLHSLVAEGSAAIWDTRAGALWCWRDAIGVRPLYLTRLSQDGVAFASDLRQLVAVEDVQTRLDLRAVRTHLVFGRFFAPGKTLVSGIEKLKPGHIATTTGGAWRSAEYWSPSALAAPTQRRRPELEELAQELGELMRIVVEERVEPGQRVTTHTSGGLDSSTITALAAECASLRGSTVDAYSWAPSREVYPNPNWDERYLAEAVCAAAGVELRHSTMSVDDMVSVHTVDRALQHVTTLEPEWSVQRQAAARGSHTILSGWGGDEGVVFNGRGFFAQKVRSGRLLTAHRELRKRRDIHGGSLLGAWKHRVFMPLRDQWLGRDRTARDTRVPLELRPEIRQALGSCIPYDEPLIVPEVGTRQMQLTLLSFGHLQARAESWASFGLNNALVYSFPMLDRRVLEFALNLPSDAYFHEGWKRWLFRTAIDGLVPDEVRWHPDKQDQALDVRLHELGPAFRAAMRERLHERTDNPYVDIDALMRADVGDGRRLGTDYWLAFINCEPAAS